MMTQWHEFLATHGAVLVDGRVRSHGDEAAELQAAATGNVIADLSHLGLLQVEGADAVAFLQGQVTSDIRQLDGSNSHYAGYCTPKGRLLALFLAFARDDRIHLQLNGALLEPVMKRLRMYVLRAKATITDVSADMVRIGLAGEQSAAALGGLFAQVPQQAHQLTTSDHGTLLRLPGPLPRYELFCDAVQAAEIWTDLAQHFRPVGSAAWDWLEIAAGIPDITPQTQEAFVPQMVNLDALGGISFKKGCYTGQEIVARTHYLGKVKRRTQLAHVDSDAMPQPGDALQAADGNEAGQIVRSAPSPSGGYDVLAEIRLESLQTGTVSWHAHALQIAQLPYALE
jgi:folate-binding protein YgfZ